jgi:kynurenine formamidase
MIPGRVNPLHVMVQINQEIFGPGTVACSDDAVTLGLQAATHWDALTHVSHSGKLYNGRPAGTITPHGGAEFSGIDKPRHIVSRGVLLDIPRARGVDRLAGGHAVTPEDLDAAEELAGTRVRSGDIVLVRTGQIQVYLAGDKHAYGYPSPGLSIRTPEWFHTRDVAAVANDTLTFEVFPPEIDDLWLPVHALDLVEMGMLQGQNWNLEELSTACGQLNRYAFLLSAMPEPFVGGTGTPVAPVAIL